MTRLREIFHSFLLKFTFPIIPVQKKKTTTTTYYSPNFLIPFTHLPYTKNTTSFHNTPHNINERLTDRLLWSSQEDSTLITLNQFYRMTSSMCGLALFLQTLVLTSHALSVSLFWFHALLSSVLALILCAALWWCVCSHVSMCAY